VLAVCRYVSVHALLLCPGTLCCTVLSTTPSAIPRRLTLSPVPTSPRVHRWTGWLSRPTVTRRREFVPRKFDHLRGLATRREDNRGRDERPPVGRVRARSACDRRPSPGGCTDATLTSIIVPS